MIAHNPLSTPNPQSPIPNPLLPDNLHNQHLRHLNRQGMMVARHGDEQGAVEGGLLVNNYLGVGIEAQGTQIAEPIRVLGHHPHQAQGNPPGPG